MTSLYFKYLFAASRIASIRIAAMTLGFLVPLTVAAQTASLRVPPDNAGTASSAPSTPAPQQTTSYPDQKLDKGRIEGTLGAIKLRFYGLILLNISASDSVEIGQDVPLWPAAGGNTFTFPDGSTRRNGMIHDTIFTARQSVFGFTVTPANPPEHSWRPTGVLEFDFFGGRPVDGLAPEARVFNQPRLRKAYLQLEKHNWKLLAGQDDMIISPLDPISLSHVGVPLGATAGDLWARLPQVRAEFTHSFGETTTLFQVGLLRPLFGDPRLNELPAGTTSLGSIDVGFSGFGERASAPFYQTRFAVSRPMSGSTFTVGIGGHFGSEAVGANRNVHSWAGTIDASIPLTSRVIFRGEGFVGSNLVPFQGGILQGVVATPAAAPFAQIHPLGAAGGWFELTFRATADDKNNFYIGGGGDYPRNRQLLPPSNRSKNNVAWASYFRKLTKDVTVAFEWSNWQFVTKTFTSAGSPGAKGPTGRGNVLNIAFAYQF